MTKGAKLRTLRVSRRGGTPAKAGVDRYPSGQIVHGQREPLEKQHEIMATATAQPHRRPFDDKRSPLAGHAGGRLYLSRTITKPQFQALETYARLSIRYMRDVLGQSVHFARMTIEPTPEKRPDDEWLKGKSAQLRSDDDVWRLKEDHAAALCALQDAGDFASSMRILFAVGVMDREPGNDLELGNLRCALNALVRLWKVGE